MNPVSPETSSKITEWRHKAALGTLTQDEMREAIKMLRGDRLMAQSTAKSPKSKGPAKSVDDLLSELDGL